MELTDESIIGYIQKLIVYKGRIYILDTQTSSLFIFDMEGRFYQRYKVSDKVRENILNWTFLTLIMQENRFC